MLYHVTKYDKSDIGDHLQDAIRFLESESPHCRLALGTIMSPEAHIMLRLWDDENSQHMLGCQVSRSEMPRFLSYPLFIHPDFRGVCVGTIDALQNLVWKMFVNQQRS